MIAISVSDLDKNENLINTPYATYDLRKGLAGEQPHNPEDLITKITACSPGEEGKQIWLDALNLFFCKDQKLIDYVQETVGMAAIGKVYQEHMIIAYGGGANGKSTFWNTIFRVLGNYAGRVLQEHRHDQLRSLGYKVCVIMIVSKVYDKCYEEGHITMATVVDHIKPHRGDQKLFWDRSNWQPLCEHHHNVKTMTEDRFKEYRF